MSFLLVKTSSMDRNRDLQMNVTKRAGLNQ